MVDRSGIVVTALTIALVGPGCGSDSTPSDLEGINLLQQRVDQAIVAGDTEAYVALITVDAVLMPPNAPAVVGREAIRAWSNATSKQFRFQDYQSSDDEVVVAGDWAFRRASAEWVLIPLPSGEPIRESGKFIIIYERQTDGSWRLARDIWNSSMPMH
jgi:uncharacterized protein (TIGR02246 family)